MASHRRHHYTPLQNYSVPPLGRQRIVIPECERASEGENPGGRLHRRTATAHLPNRKPLQYYINNTVSLIWYQLARAPHSLHPSIRATIQ